jgi:UDP-N-acetylmuramate dehydrogenase
MEKIDKIKTDLIGVQESVSLAKYTTLGLGGDARFFYEAKSVDDLIRAIIVARNLAIVYKVIGYGSNVLVSDNGFDGLIILNRASSIKVEHSTGRVIADSGASLTRVIVEAGAQGLSGLEALYGIPGTVGGAALVNAGAHAVSIESFIKSATILISSDKIISVTPDWFEFEYRSSKLKHKHDDFPPIILSVIFQFHQKKNEGILNDISTFKKWREKHQPIGEKTCGSIFKNPGGSDNLATTEPERSAGWLLDQVGAKKLRVGGIRVSKKHANWIINSGHSSAKDARLLIEQMRNAVREKYSLDLNEELEYLGNWNDI